METMRTIVLVTCVISLISGVLDALKPNAKFDRQMRLLLSSVFLLAILTPFAKGLRSYRPELESEVSVPTDFTAVMAEQTEACAADNLEASLTQLLRQGGVADAKVEVEMHISEDNSIEINRVTAVCTDTVTADALLAECLGEEVRIHVEKAS